MDVGTGTGCMALSLAREGQFGLVIAVDRSPQRSPWPAANIAASGSPGSAGPGDLSEALAPGSVDVLVSNPPYVSRCRIRLAWPIRRTGLGAAAGAWSGADGLEATAGYFRGWPSGGAPGWLARTGSGLHPGPAGGSQAARSRVGRTYWCRMTFLAALATWWRGGGILMWDKAQELGRLIGQTPEYKAFGGRRRACERTRRA